MARPVPTTPDAWITEIGLAWDDAAEAKPFAWLTLSILTPSKMFHLAPMVALKFRGRSLTGADAKRVVETALANYVVNTDEGAPAAEAASEPRIAFALCYIAAHLAMGILEETEAGEVMNAYEAAVRAV